MFGSFDSAFGLSNFPWDSLDPQGGLFGANAPEAPLIGSQPSGIAEPQQGAAAPSPGAAINPGSVAPPAATAQPGGQSPLASPLARQASPGNPPSGFANPSPPQQNTPPAPAAGVGSPFGGLAG